MRLFVAVDIDDAIRERISRFLEGVRGFAEEARWVRPESLHVTLKFIGEKSEEEVEKIKCVLGTIEAGTFEMSIRGYGFFPSARAPRVFWVGIEGGPEIDFSGRGGGRKAGGARNSEGGACFYSASDASAERGRLWLTAQAKGRPSATKAFSACRKSWRPSLRQILAG